MDPITAIRTSTALLLAALSLICCLLTGCQPDDAEVPSDPDNPGVAEAAVDPESPEDSAEYRAFDEAIDGDDGAQALALAEALRDKFPDSSVGWRSSGMAHGALGEYQKAIESFRRAIELDPEHAGAHSILGAALAQQGKTDEAIKSCRRAIELDPEYAMAHNNLGYALVQQGKADEAIKSYRRAIELDPNNAMAHNRLGYALMQQGKTDEALESFRRAIEINPANAMAHSNLGGALQQQGKADEAIESFRRAIELDPDHANAQNNLGGALMQQGKLDEAIESLHRAIELDPDDDEVHSNLGAALFQQGKTDEAIESFRRAIELHPEYAGAHINLGIALRQQGKLDEAIESHRRAIELEPRNLVAIANLANVYAKLEQVDRCGIWSARWGLAKGVADEASLVKQVGALFLQLNVELPSKEPIDQEIRGYYEASKEIFSATAVQLRTLSLPKDKKTREFADELREKLASGDEYFPYAAKLHSDDLAADDGGDRGWMKRGDLRADLLDAAFALKAGEISAVIEDDSHYRILNTVEHRDGTPPPLDEVREQIVAKLIEQAQARRIQGWIEQARKEHAEAMAKVKASAGDAITTENADGATKPGEMKPAADAPPPTTGASPEADDTKPPVTAVGPLLENAPKRLAQQLQVLKTFLDSATWQERLPITYQADHLEETIAAYYGEGDGKHADGPIGPYELEFFHLDESTEDGGPYYIFFVNTPQNPDGFPAIVRRTAEGFKVDWESFAEFHDQQFKKYHESGAAGPREFRVVLKRTTYPGPDRKQFTNLDNYLCYRVDLPYTDEDFYAFVSKDDLLADSVGEKVNWGKPPLAAIVRFERADFSHGKSHLKIVGLVDDGWHLDPAGDDPPLPAAETAPPSSPANEILGATPEPKPTSQAKVIREMVVEWIGPTTLTDDQLLSKISIEVGEALSIASLDDAIEALHASGIADNVQFFSKPMEGNDVRLIVRVTTRSLLVDVQVRGASAISDEEILSVAQLTAGEPLDVAAVKEGRANIQEIYREEGFAEATVGSRITPTDEAGEVIVVYSIEENGSVEAPRSEPMEQPVPVESAKGSEDGEHTDQADAFLEELRKDVVREPDDAVAWYKLGSKLCKSGKLDESKQALLKAIELVPDSPKAWIELGAVLVEQGQFDEAIKASRKAIGLESGVATPWTNLAAALVGLGKFDQAVEAAQTAIELDPDIANAHNNLGPALIKQGKIDEAIASIRRAIELDPEFAEAHGNLGNALFQQGKLDEAVESFRRTIELDPELALAHGNLGNALFQQGKLDEAIQSYRRSIELDPEFAEAHLVLGNVLAQRGQKDEAVESYRRAIELDPEYAMAHFNLGFTLFEQGQIDEAIESYHRAIKLDPEYAMAHNNLAQAFLEKGQLEQAIEASRRAIELDPELAAAHVNLSGAFGRQGKLERAIEASHRAIEIDPNLAMAHLNLGSALLQQGKPAKAIEPYQRAIELDPKLLMAIANLASVHAKLEQVDRCGIWCARWGLAKGVADEASLVKQVGAWFLKLKVELPPEQPTDQQVRDYYEANQATLSATAVHLRTLSLPKGTTTRKFADELRDKLVAGGDFAAAAKQHSDDLASDDGGDRSWVKRGELRKDLIDAAFALDAGEISAVIEDDSHYRILQTVELREGTPPPLGEVREKIVTKLIEEAQAKRIQGWIVQARKEHAAAMNR